MKRMDLSAAEKKGIKIRLDESSRAQVVDPKAVGKVLAEKLINAEGLAQALGRIWCPIKGVGCKDLGENHFLFTFYQHTGKRRALEDGPWMFGKDLVVLVEYDEMKTIDEMEFAHIPIWIRVTKMPLGMMNKTMGEAIGGEVGEFMEMEKEDDGTAVGRFLRIKIRLDIRKPLMRGVTLFVGEKEKPVWCPLVYEYLPDFCYTCGLIGHIDKVYGRKLKKGEIQQFNKTLRFIPEKRRMEDGTLDRFKANRAHTHVRLGGGSGSRGNISGTTTKLGSGGSGSDAPSWRKSRDGESSKMVKQTSVEEEEVNSPIKQLKNVVGGETAKKALFVSGEKKGEGVEEGEQGVLVLVEKHDMIGDGKQPVSSDLQAMHVDQGVEKEDSNKIEEEGKGRKNRTYKRVVREGQGKPAPKMSLGKEKKRVMDVIMTEDGAEGEEQGGVGEGETHKRMKKAGLADQPCVSK